MDMTEDREQDSMLTPDVAPEEPPDMAPDAPPPDMAPDSTADDAADAAIPGVGSPEKDPSDWVTGNEPMTGPQRSYLETLSREAGEDLDESLNKAQASARIDELQTRTGRGAQGN